MFWLYDWIDDRHITSVAQAKRRLRNPKELPRLQAQAAAVPYTTEPLPTALGESLLAGRGFDLTGDLDCFAWSCRQKQVDTLLSRAWHYFDRVVVVGPSAFRVASDLASGPTELATDRLLSDIQLLLYLREIGAESLVLFRQKPPRWAIHVEQHAHEVGLEVAMERLDGIAKQLAAEAKIETRVHGDHVHYAFVHPRFEHTVWGTAWPNEGDVREEVSRAVLGRYMAHLTSYVRAARSLGLPLGSTIQTHGDLLSLTRAAPSSTHVMFNLRLPVVDGVDVRTLLELRDQEREYFERFRQALRAAVDERLRSDDSDSQRVADSVQRDVIEPALIDINARLKAAADTLATKTRMTTPPCRSTYCLWRVLRRASCRDFGCSRRRCLSPSDHEKRRRLWPSSVVRHVLPLAGPAAQALETHLAG